MKIKLSPRVEQSDQEESVKDLVVKSAVLVIEKLAIVLKYERIVVKIVIMNSLEKGETGHDNYPKNFKNLR